MSRKLFIPEIIENRILWVKGEKVMLDKDLAALYHVKPTALRQQVKRNKERFPSDFCFQLNDKEINFLVSQSVIPFKRGLSRIQPPAAESEISFFPLRIKSVTKQKVFLINACCYVILLTDIQKYGISVLPRGDHYDQDQ
jgi:hypothetical protein